MRSKNTKAHNILKKKQVQNLSVFCYKVFLRNIHYVCIQE